MAIIDERDLLISWQYEGYCRAPKESVIEFSIDSENFVPFDELECFAYDLQQDPERLQKIHPMLVGSDGLSKKIAVPFIKRLVSEERFCVLLQCKLPGCIRPGVQYYTSTMSFGQRRVGRYSLRLVFAHEEPRWLRVYECESPGQPGILKTLRPIRRNEFGCEYADIEQDVPGQFTRLYLFETDGAERR